MPSTLSSLLTITTLLSSAYSLPAPGRPGSGSGPNKRPQPPTHQQLSIQQLQVQQPTLTGLASNTNATLQYVGLGVGVQNYTCASTTATPKSVGAIATLFDVTEFLQGTTDLSSNISAVYLKAYEGQSCKPNPADLSDHSCEENVNRLNFDVLGEHFFANVNGAGVASFDIYSQSFLSAVKAGDVKAPSNAYDGSNDAGAVDWLFLPSDGSSRTFGTSEGYRINTAGGTPTSDQCSDGKSAFSVKYAAEYWFYL